MSHFEYVSVAYALLYALAIGRLLGGLSPAMDVGRRYWVHLIWILVLLLATVMAWWVGWRSSEVVWTPLRFLFGLSLPAFIFVRASVLLGNSNDLPDSYYDHFYEIRLGVFSLGVAVDHRVNPFIPRPRFYVYLYLSAQCSRGKFVRINLRNLCRLAKCLLQPLRSRRFPRAKHVGKVLLIRDETHQAHAEIDM